jgi:hypothetical protein
MPTNPQRRTTSPCFVRIKPDPAFWQIAKWTWGFHRWRWLIQSQPESRPLKGLKNGFLLQYPEVGMHLTQAPPSCSGAAAATGLQSTR